MEYHGEGYRMRRGGQGGRGQRFSKDSVIESNGPSGKIRGNAQQLVDRYVSFGKDALSQRDFTEAENYFQHAEHYRRLALVGRSQKILPQEDHKTTMVVPVESSENRVLEDVTEDLPSFVVDASVEQENAPETKPERVTSPRTRKPRIKKESQEG